jgi:hypothetical protein
MATQILAQFHNRIPPAQQAVHEVFREALEAVVELDIVPDAKRLSPVSDANPSLLEARGEKRRDTGHNRRTIDGVVIDTPQGPKAMIFTQSGYGGWLEIGTRKMIARPYIFPAFQLNIGRYPEELKKRLQALGGPGGLGKKPPHGVGLGEAGGEEALGA